MYFSLTWRQERKGTRWQGEVRQLILGHSEKVDTEFLNFFLDIFTKLVTKVIHIQHAIQNSFSFDYISCQLALLYTSSHPFFVAAAQHFPTQLCTGWVFTPRAKGVFICWAVESGKLVCNQISSLENSTFSYELRSIKMYTLIQGKYIRYQIHYKFR